MGNNSKVVNWKIRSNSGRLVKFDENITNDYLGMVYKITRVDTGKSYIGKKIFWNRVKLKPLKGFKRKRLTLKQSNWKTYTGSCDALNEDISKFGIQSFKFEVLHLCKSKFDLSYVELVEQINNKVLFSD